MTVTKDDKQGKIELLSLWTVGRLSFGIVNFYLMPNPLKQILHLKKMGEETLKITSKLPFKKGSGK